MTSEMVTRSGGSYLEARRPRRRPKIQLADEERASLESLHHSSQ
jgi:hypothetical protein